MSSVPAPSLLARGPWTAEQVQAVWHDEHYEPPADKVELADKAIAELAERGSPSHDGVAARMMGWRATDDGGLEIDIQPIRWALRLVPGDASQSMAALCAVRDHEGRWLAGRRAAWVASWAGRWALGAGGAVDPGESPIQTCTRELREEWSVEAARVQGEGLIALPHGMVLFVGQAWLAPGAEDQLVMDPEHDAHAWWPADVDAWPDDADEPLRMMARLLGA